MTEPGDSWAAPRAAAGASTNPDRRFPVLTDAQMARVAARGRRRQVEAGEVLVHAAAIPTSFFAVLSGRLEGVNTAGTGETVVASLGPGMFTGETNLLSGARGLVDIRVAEAGEIIEVNRTDLMSVIQGDPELSDILMRAFVLRRVALIANESGDTVVLGSTHCQGSLRIREFLTRNGHPYTWIDLDREADVQQLLDRFNVSAADVPVVICRGTVVLRNPGNREIAACLGLNDVVPPGQTYDLVIVGAGPAGLAAAVYSASEGLDVLVLETTAAGGQAGTSSRIENYLGFPTGISGQELAARAHVQALKFGARFMIATGATRLDCAGPGYTIEVDGGDLIHARAVIIATGAEYRRLPLEGLSRFEGAGVYYAATPMEAQLCGGEEVIIVGGGNSAGQAAVFLAEHARQVHILIRSGGLAETMSRYLIRRIEDHPAITRHIHTEIASLAGDRQLEQVTWRNNETGAVETHQIRHVFSMTGAVPATHWLEACVALDDRKFIKTGLDLSPDDLATPRWPLARSPHLLETNRPGVFAVGDVRSGSFKRVAAAVGEGSVAVAAVHQVLAGR